MTWKSVLKPEGSLILGAGVGGMVYGLYQLNLGNVATCHATDANHPVLETSRKKAGYTSLVMVGGLAILARDPNLIILGGAMIIAMEVHYRTAIMTDPVSGQIMPPTAAAYQPAQDIVPAHLQGQTG